MHFSTSAKWLLVGAVMSNTSVTLAQPLIPTVLTRTPGRNARNVAPTAGVSLTFSEAISANTAPFLRIYGSQSRGKRAFTTTGAGLAVLSYQPLQPFAPGELVQVSVPVSMRSAATNYGSRFETFQFRVASQPAAATFTYGTDMSVGQLPVAVAVADLDGDGDTDFVTSNRTGNSLSIRVNNGLGRFTTGQDINLSTSTMANPQPIGVQLADMDGDGDFDIVVANTYAASVSVFTNAGNGVFTQYDARSLAGTPGLLNVVDVNGDGSPDVVLQVMGNTGAGGQWNPLLLVLENNGYGSLSLGQQAPTQAGGQFATNFNYIATGDFDNDGDIDALSPFNSGVGLYVNQTTLTTTGAAVYGLAGSSTLGLPNLLIADAAVGDLDGDGDLDLVRTPTATGQIVNVHFNNGQGLFSTTNAQAVTTGASTDGLVLADMDGDGDLDLVASNYADGSISLALNNGAGVFGTATRIGVGLHPTRPAVADLNGDGRLDILVPLADDNTVLPLLNRAVVSSTRPAAAALTALYPNPAHDAATLLLAPGTGPVAVQVCDVLGRVVWARSAAAPVTDGTLNLSFPGLPAGLYRVKATGTDGSVSTRPLVIE
jgi:hypothetical protein